jgi:hypothetical protein
MLSCAGGGGSEGDAVSACWSREFFRIDLTLWYELLDSTLIFGPLDGNH